VKFPGPTRHNRPLSDVPLNVRSTPASGLSHAIAVCCRRVEQSLRRRQDIRGRGIVPIESAALPVEPGQIGQFRCLPEHGGMKPIAPFVLTVTAVSWLRA
jgi:hypothetical protein